MSFFTPTMPHASLSPVAARIAQIRRIPAIPNAYARDANAHHNREEV
jgi:hypothetical protein